MLVTFVLGYLLVNSFEDTTEIAHSQMIKSKQIIRWYVSICQVCIATRRFSEQIESEITITSELNIIMNKQTDW